MGKPVCSVFSETIMYGGLPLRRFDVYFDVLVRTGDKCAADFFAFAVPAVTAMPMSYEDFCGVTEGT